MINPKEVKYSRDNNTNISIGKRLKIRRKLMHMTQKELASAVGVTFQQIQKYEAGINKISLQLLIKLCRILQCDVDYFIGKTGLSDISNPTSFQETLEDELLLAFRSIRDVRIKNILLELVKQFCNNNF